MNEKLARLYYAILELPRTYFYALWVFAFLVILLLAFQEPTAEPAPFFGPENSRLRHETVPERVASNDGLYEDFIQRAHQKTRVRSEAASKVAQLESFVKKQFLGEFPTKPTWISQRFVGSGIDREKFATRFSADNIQVQRWRTSDAAPKYDGERAFSKWIGSSFEPWKSATDFEIALRPYRTTIAGNTITIGVVVECFGQTAKSGGRQATSIWSSQWNRLAGSLQLESISVVAQEEVASDSGGKLFEDCTTSLLQRCDVLEHQLAFGLDEWAKRIPHLDVVGNQGIAIGDVNRDGLDDLYVCQAHGLPNLLLVQNPDGTVEDLGSEMAVDVLDQSFAALIVDIDNDRDQDLIVSTDESLLMFSNKGSGEFLLEHSSAMGRGAQSLSAADFDQDGDLDLFLCKYGSVYQNNDLLVYPSNLLDASDGGRNVLLRNDEGWKFTDATEQVGLTHDNRDYTRCGLWVDFDMDGDQDLYVANEFSKNRIYQNDSGWFTDVSEKLNLKNVARHRTASIGEFNQDGRFDFFVGNDAPLEAGESFSDTPANQNSDLQEIGKLLSGESQAWL